MRLIFTLLIASMAGSLLVGGVRLGLKGQPDNAAKTVYDLYRKDKRTTIRLITVAVDRCYPDLAKVHSSEMRKVISRVVVRLLEARDQRIDVGNDKIRREILLSVVNPTLKGASGTDLLRMDAIVNQPARDKAASVRCIMENVISLSVQKHSRQPAIPGDAVLRGT